MSNTKFKEEKIKENKEAHSKILRMLKSTNDQEAFDKINDIFNRINEKLFVTDFNDFNSGNEYFHFHQIEIQKLDKFLTEKIESNLPMN